MKRILMIMLMIGMTQTATAGTVDTSKAVIHHTAGSAKEENMDVRVKDIDRWHKERGWTMIGYHFLILKNGVVEIGRPITMKGAHAKGRNHYVGIALVGYGSFTPLQIRSLKKLLRRLGVKHIENHHSNCPGPRLRLDLIAKDLKITFKKVN